MLLPLWFFSCTETFNESDMLGTWTGLYKTNEIRIQFNQNGEFLMIVEDHNTEVKNELNGLYKLDFSKKPNTLSLRKIKQINHPLHTILEFKSINQIRLGNFAPRWRIRDISFDRNSSFILTKVDKSKFFLRIKIIK